MKEYITYSCGHEGTVQLFGKAADRERKIQYLQTKCVCPECAREQKNIEKSIGHKEVEMSYREYKTNYSNCETKVGSYNGDTKTIVVYVPEQEESETREISAELGLNGFYGDGEQVYLATGRIGRVDGKWLIEYKGTQDSKIVYQPPRYERLDTETLL